jgi:hypothetical protein
VKVARRVWREAAPKRPGFIHDETQDLAGQPTLPQLRCRVSDAEIADVPYTAFASKKGQAITARLIVRRVRDLNKQAGDGQDELFAVWRHHAVLTDSPVELVISSLN